MVCVREQRSFIRVPSGGRLLLNNQDVHKPQTTRKGLIERKDLNIVGDSPKVIVHQLERAGVPI